MNAKECKRYKTSDCCYCKNASFYILRAAIEEIYAKIVFNSEKLTGDEFKQYINETLMPEFVEVLNVYSK